MVELLARLADMSRGNSTEKWLKYFYVQSLQDLGPEST
jgi:hypothetical protein